MTIFLLFVAFLAAVLGIISVLVGFVFCHLFYGRWLLYRSGRRNIVSLIFDPRAGLSLEHDLEGLASDTGSLAAKNTIKLMTICKYSIIVNLLLFIGVLVLVKFII